MLKAILLFVLTLNLAYAGRFEEGDKKKFIDEVKQEIAQHKLENHGKVDLQIIKPEFYKGLDELHQHQKLTKDEALVIKQRFENFSKDKSVTPQNAEAAFFAFLEFQLNEINQRPIQRAKENDICNNIGCEKGYTCAPDPRQDYGNLCRQTGLECKVDGDCCSNECVEDPRSRRKVCEDVYRCFRPLDENQACNTNPVCGVGSCLPFNSLVAGIGECVENTKACKANSDCCSNLCQGGVCKENFICKDCVQRGKKADRGRKCCEGLIESESGICIPDVPPVIPPQVKHSVLKSVLVATLNLFIPAAEASNADLYNFTAPTKEECEASIASRLPTLSGRVTCSIGGGCGVSCGVPTTTCTSANPSSWGACVDSNIISATNPNATDDDPSDLANIVAASKEDCDKAIGAAFKDKQGSCTVGGGCGINCGKPSSTCVSANPTLYGICTDGSDLAYIPGKEPKSDAEVAADDEKFLTSQQGLDNSDIVSTIKNNGDKYGAGFIAKSDTFKPEEKKIDALKLTRKSNFDTCEIRFKDDFMTYLHKNNLLELEMAVLGFDFVMSGDGVADYWSNNGGPTGSIYYKLKEASKVSKENRKKLWETIEATNKELTCMCLDAKGLANIKLEEKKKFFMESCSEYAKYTDPTTPKEELDGDASGVKAKKLIVAWTGKLSSFNRDIVVDHSKIKEEVKKAQAYMDDDQVWSETTQKTYTLFNFNIKNPSGSAAALGAVLGAILAAGVIAIMGGFGTASILTAWGAAGIITASAVTGAGGLWMISSLRGAWITKRPEIFDKYIRSYGCGKKETCVEYSRELIQPWNDICKVHTSANACVKDFLVIREKGYKNGSESMTEESIFLVDPWVPWGIQKTQILKDSPNGPTYAEKMEQGFQSAKAAMIAKNPGASGGGGKKGGGEFVPESYLSEVFLDPTLVGKYVPQLGNLEEKYFFRGNQIKEIKDAAKKFALEQKFFEPQDTANLAIFAEYAYEYHFVYPKRSRLNEISYPAVGLRNYVDHMVNNVLGTLSANAANAFGNGNRGFSRLHVQYLEDLRNTLGLYERAMNSSDPGKKAAIKKDIATIDAELERIKTIGSFVNNNTLDTGDAMGKAVSNFSTGNNRSVLTASDKAYLNAVGKMRADRKGQIKKFEHYKKAIAARGDKTRSDKMNRAAASFTSKFSKPISGGGSRLGSSLADTANSADENAANGIGQAGANANPNGAYGAGFNPDSLGAGALGAAGNIFGSGSGSGSGNKGSTSGSYNNANNSGNGNNGMSDEDRKRLADAIDARNRNKGKYQSENGQTLFEKVTNAYIRNYDKVLSKKKDKDVVEAPK